MKKNSTQHALHERSHQRTRYAAISQHLVVLPEPELPDDDGLWLLWPGLGPQLLWRVDWWLSAPPLASGARATLHRRRRGSCYHKKQ